MGGKQVTRTNTKWTVTPPLPPLNPNKPDGMGEYKHLAYGY